MSDQGMFVSVQGTTRDGATVNGVAKSYSVAPGARFRWRRDFTNDPSQATAELISARVKLNGA